MNCTYLIGNGFDLAAGLPTKTEYFIDYILSDQKSEFNVLTHPPIGNTKQSSKDDIKLNPSSLRDALNINPDMWSDFELAIGELTQYYNEGREDVYLCLIGQIAEHLGNWLTNCETLIDIESIKSQGWTVLADMLSFINDLPGAHQSILMSKQIWESNSECNLNIISFNYTSLLKSLVQSTRKKGPLDSVTTSYGQAYPRIKSIIFPHGNLATRELIFGVDNEQQIKNPAFKNNEDIKATIIKHNIEEGIFGNSRDKAAFNAISRSNLICVYGMSFGLTDRRWWRAISERMQQDVSVHTVLFDFGLTQILRSTNQVSKHSAIQQCLKRFQIGGGITDEEFREIQNRVLVIPSSAVFDFEFFALQPQSA